MGAKEWQHGRQEENLAVACRPTQTFPNWNCGARLLARGLVYKYGLEDH